MATIVGRWKDRASSVPAPEEAPRESSLSTGRALVAGAAVVAIGFALRLWALGQPSFWWDEAYSTLVASKGLREIVATLAREDYHPPLHYVILHYWMRVAGSSEVALRFVSVWFGVLAVAAAWTAARRLIGPRAAPIAALIFAFSPFLWYYSQEARMFALVPALGTLALYFCARASAERRRLFWLGYALVVALGFWDFYYAVFTPIVCGIWLVLDRRDRRALAAWLAATGLAVASYLPWVPIFLSRTEVWSSAFTPENGPAKVITWTWPELLLGLPNLALYRQPGPALLLGLGVLATLIAIGLALRGRRERPGLLLVVLAFVGPFALIAAISAVKPVFHPRYAIPVASGLYLLLASGFDHAFFRSPKVAPRLLGAVGAVVLVVGFTYGFYHLRDDGAYARDDYRSAIARVSAVQQPGDVLADNAIPPVWYYYHGPAPTAYLPTGAYTAAGVAANLNQLTQGHARLWYLDNITIPSDPDGFVDAQLRQHAQRLEEHWYGPIRVQLWQIPGDGAFQAAQFSPASVNVANQLTLTGYSIQGEVVGGKSVDVELRWETQNRPPSDDGFWVALVDNSGRTWGRADVRPRDAAFRLTSGWTSGQSNDVRFDLPIALGTPPGQYSLAVGVYRLSDLAGLDVVDQAGHPIGQQARIASVDVAQVSGGATDPTLPSQVNLGVTPGLTLVAHDATPRALAPGDHLAIALLWKSSAALPRMTADLRLQGADGKMLARADGAIGGAFTTEQWPAGALIREQRELVLSSDAPSGKVSLVLAVAGRPPVALQEYTVVGVDRVFTAPSPSHPSAAVFGETIGLAGYDLSSSSLRPGDQLAVTLDWHALRATSTSYHVFVHLLDAQNQIVAQSDGVPRDWTYPTSAWLPGEYVTDRYTLKLPPGMKPQSLTLEVGLYDATTDQRLKSSAPGQADDDRVVLAPIQVVAP